MADVLLLDRLRRWWRAAGRRQRRGWAIRLGGSLTVVLAFWRLEEGTRASVVVLLTVLTAAVLAVRWVESPSWPGSVSTVATAAAVLVVLLALPHDDQRARGVRLVLLVAPLVFDWSGSVRQTKRWHEPAWPPAPPAPSSPSPPADG